jgi:hypothetical protein
VFEATSSSVDNPKYVFSYPEVGLVTTMVLKMTHYMLAVFLIAVYVVAMASCSQ